MNICPITYEPCAGKYSEKGLRRLARGLSDLHDLPYTAGEQLREAAARADKLSIQGIQPKLSARLVPRRKAFVLVDRGGTYILKPPNPLFVEIPENEDLTMRLAESAGIEVPLHGLVYAKDGSRTYFIRRFDRTGRRRKLAVEDFAQLTGRTRETKYAASMEKVAAVVSRHCTFPAVEFVKLFRLTIFCFLTGNEDMHLKNFSLITRGNKVELSPAYDLVNSTIALRRPEEELALPLKGKKRNLTRRDFLVYFGEERLKLTRRAISRIAAEIQESIPLWEDRIRVCFLSDEMKEAYRDLLRSRKEVLFPN